MAGLSRDRIVDAAFDLLAADGLDGITARALGERLGVRAGALYYHLRDMRQLQDEMATRIVAAMLAEEWSGGAWDELLRTGGHRIRSTLLGYRDGAKLVSGTTLTDDAALRRLEAPLRALVDAGFDPLDATRALSSLNAYVTGFVIEEQHRHPVPGSDASSFTADDRRARLDAEAQPLSYAVSDEVAELPEEAFTWGLEALIAGIGARTGR